jgi:hypothetical protein
MSRLLFENSNKAAEHTIGALGALGNDLVPE